MKMDKNRYEIIFDFFKLHPVYLSILTFLNRLITAVGFFMYPLLLVPIAVKSDKRFFAYLFVPAFCFFAMGRIRKLINRKRPYECYDFKPLISRDGSGESFPSRHVFSIFLIATLWIHIFPPVGVLLYTVGLGLAVIRVMAGVHFPSDVIAGAFLGIFCGMLTLFISLL